MTKTLVILANSYRMKHRCIAGKELVSNGARWDVCGWVRLAHPDTEQGAVPLECALCEDGTHAAVLDIIEVQVRGSCDDPNHPEDWFLEPGETWRRVRRVP